MEFVRRLAREHSVTLYAAAIRSPVPEDVTVVQVPALGGSAYARILSFPLAFAAVRRKHDVVHAQGWVATSADVVTTHIVMAGWRDAARRAHVESPPGERFLGGFVAPRERGLVRRAERVIVPSRRAAKDVAQFYGRTQGVRVIHHGFPITEELPARDAARLEFGLPSQAFVALYAGDARKGFDSATTALVGAPSVRLLVASRSRRDAYLTRASAIGVADRIHWAGEVDDIRKVFAAVDVLLHPTIYDTFAMVVAEAMAYGVPAIVSREAGIADLIKHRESGWVLAAGLSDTANALITSSAILLWPRTS